MVEINLQNVGFAPMYKEAEGFCILKSADSNDYLSFQIDGDIRSLCGGRESNTILTLQKEIELAGYAPGQYDLYFYSNRRYFIDFIALRNKDYGLCRRFQKM